MAHREGVSLRYVGLGSCQPLWLSAIIIASLLCCAAGTWAKCGARAPMSKRSKPSSLISLHARFASTSKTSCARPGVASWLNEQPLLVLPVLLLPVLVLVLPRPPRHKRSRYADAGVALLCATVLTCDGAHSTQAGSAAEQHILSVATTMLASSFNLHATTPAPAQQRALLKSRLCAQFPDALTEDEWQWDHCLWQQLPTGMRRFVVHLVQDLTGIQVAIRARRRASCCCLIRNGLIPCVQMRVMATTVTDAHGTEHRVTRFTATSMQPQSKRLQLPHVCLLAIPAGCGVSTVPMPHAMTL